MGTDVGEFDETLISGVPPMQAKLVRRPLIDIDAMLEAVKFAFGVLTFLGAFGLTLYLGLHG
jgi:hypothetical protein